MTSRGGTPVVGEWDVGAGSGGTARGVFVVLGLGSVVEEPFDSVGRDIVVGGVDVDVGGRVSLLILFDLVRLGSGDVGRDGGSWDKDTEGSGGEAGCFVVIWGLQSILDYKLKM